MPTGSLIRVLGTGIFLSNTQYYDEDGRPIQSIEENLKSGKDITTLQYHFDGRLLSTHTRHQNTGSDFNNYTVLTKHLFDKIGRVTSVQKKYGGQDFVTIGNYDFDDMGRLKTKHLAPGYKGSGGAELESLAYSYNIHSQITGINKDYALKTPGLYNKWGHYFGLYIGYDNKDGTFAKAELNGQVSGQLWTTMGDDAQRRYDYTYDNAGRLLSANFTEREKPGDTWNTEKMNLGVSGQNGRIGYDLNGNILSMIHKGVLPGSNGTVTVDDLSYTYAAYSNKLLKVTDASPLGNLNGSLGDFKDGSNGSDNDYVYDDNGNLVIDLNKNITPPPGSQPGIAGVGGVIYNYLDKPEQITLAGKGVIKIVYDADGNKLQRMYLPEAADKPNATVTTYIDQYLYQEIVAKKDITAAYTKPGGTVQYLNFEEGRIRVVQPVTQNNGFEALQIAGSISLPNGKQGSMDYYIRDYQQNVRVIVTDETHLSSGTASMEQSRATQEEGVFGQTGGANELAQTRWPVNQIPGQQSGGGWQNPNIGNSVARLGNLAAGKVGPNSLLKVMAGDQVSATAQYYYQQPAGNSGSSNIVSNVINSLVAVLNSSAPDLIHRHLGDITSQLTRDPALGSIIQPTEGSLPSGPKAYLSVLFFDERFNFIGEASNQKQATEADNSNASLTLLNLKAPKNGYAYIYVSNSSDVNVFFDNLKVAHNRGRIVEENHYYAFGLRIAGISSRKLADGTGNEGQVKNEFGYNDKELFDDGDLNWSDYGFRNYDAQIGRFTQLDPLTHDYHFLTPYQYASNDPITNIDLDGLEGVGATIFKGATEAIATASADMARLAGKEIGEVVVKTSIKKVAAKAAEKAAMKLFNEVLKYSAMLANAALGELQQRNESQQAGQQAKDVQAKSSSQPSIRPYDVDGGTRLPKQIQTISGKVSLRFTSNTSDSHTSDNLISPNAVSSFVEGIKLANENGAAITDLTISATTNGTHDMKNKPYPNWNRSRSTHYVRNGARAIDIDDINGLNPNKFNKVKILMEALRTQPGIYEVYGPGFDFKNGNWISSQHHTTWIHASFK